MSYCVDFHVAAAVVARYFDATIRPEPFVFRLDVLHVSDGVLHHQSIEKRKMRLSAIHEMMGR